MTGEIMTRADREILVKIARQRERLAKTEAKERAALLVSDFEKQLDRRYHYDENEIWAASHKIAEETVERAQAAVEAECAKLGIPAQFAPRLSLEWYMRGRNSVKGERAEMRRVAMRTIDAMEKSAKTAIERRSVETQEKIMIGSLTTDEARRFLADMPTAENLMPSLSVANVEALLIEENRSS